MSILSRFTSWLKKQCNKILSGLKNVWNDIKGPLAIIFIVAVIVVSCGGGAAILAAMGPAWTAIGAFAVANPITAVLLATFTLYLIDPEMGREVISVGGDMVEDGMGEIADASDEIGEAIGNAVGGIIDGLSNSTTVRWIAGGIAVLCGVAAVSSIQRSRASASTTELNELKLRRLKGG